MGNIHVWTNMSATSTRWMVALILKSDTTPCLQPQPLISLAGWCRWDTVGLQICISQTWKQHHKRILFDLRTDRVALISLNPVWIPSRRQPQISLQRIPNHCREGCEKGSLTTWSTIIISPANSGLVAALSTNMIEEIVFHHTLIIPVTLVQSPRWAY